MPDDKPTQPGQTPDRAVPEMAPPLRDAEANRQIGEGRAPDVADERRDADAPPPESGDRPPNVGAAHAPVGADDVEDRADKTLYDRLADKDATPTGESGSGLL